MINFNEFKEEVVKNIKNYLPNDYLNHEVKITNNVKGNDTVFCGLSLVRENELSVSPTIYLEGRYAKYIEGEPLDDVIKKIAHDYVSANKEKGYFEHIINELISTYHEESVFPCLVSMENNEEFLKDVPHKNFCNMAIYYRLRVSDDATTCITNSLLKKWGVSEQTIYEDAMENLKDSAAGGDLLSIMLGSASMENVSNISIGEMYVLSNMFKTYGAASILLLESGDITVDTDCYILPSSVHECILVPTTVLSPDKLQAMVKEININEVAREEQLSDSVYFFNVKERKISVA